MRGGKRDPEVGECSLDLRCEAAIAHNELTIIDPHLPRYHGNTNARVFRNDHLRKEGAPVWQSGRIQMCQFH